ncbi:MAG: putative transcriptional regulatory protein TcrX [Smithella sp. PtaU1.Bin162]|nr:MAG: putative transcriptional regulatory protein TcrX [Smithella sp. PtaU1.Bin162]
MGKPINILAVDDEESFTFFVKLNLQNDSRYEFNVTTANGGEAGLKLARKIKPDLILLDIMMPDMSGTEVAEKLLEDPRTKSIPIIFMTAVVQKDEVAEEGGIMGGREFIAKPVEKDELIDRIAATLNLPR